jgi:hypothetical protein
MEAQRRTIQHSRRSVEAVEWNSDREQPTIVVAVDGDALNLVSPIARMLMDTFRVIGVSPSSADDLTAVAKSLNEPFVFLAQGSAGKAACEAAMKIPAAIKALVLAEYAPKPGSRIGETHASLTVPTLVFRGRQSTAESHEQAVHVHEEIPGSQLIELDNCGNLPTRDFPTQLSESVRWFLDELGQPYMEFEDFPGSEAEPVDPKT